MLLARPCFVHKTFLWAKKTPSFSGRSDNSSEKSRKALSGRKKKFEETIRVLRVLSTSDVPGQVFLSARFTDHWLSLQFKNVVTSPENPYIYGQL